MKISLVVFVCATLGLSGTASLSAMMPTPTPSSADRAWMVLRTPFPAMAPLPSPLREKVERLEHTDAGTRAKAGGKP